MKLLIEMFGKAITMGAKQTTNEKPQKDVQRASETFCLLLGVENVLSSVFLEPGFGPGTLGLFVKPAAEWDRNPFTSSP